MKSRSQMIGLLILFVLVLGYTVYNYMTGGTSLMVLCAAVLLIGLPMFNVVRALIDSFK